MSTWASEVELREENGTMRAYRIRDNREIPIPKYPKPGADMHEWLVHLSMDELEAARQFYLDKWTWDEDSERYPALVALVASELSFRLPWPPGTPGGLRDKERVARVVLDMANRIQKNDRRSG